MARLRKDDLSGTITVDLASNGTTLASPGLAALPVVASPDYMIITINPLGAGGLNPERVKVTAHTSSATTATIVRAQEGTIAQAYLAANLVLWRVAPTAQDWTTVRNVLNVREFGALSDADSSNFDSTTSIQNAINACPTAAAGASSGWIVYIPAGTWWISAQLTLPAGVRLVGAGDEATYLKALPAFSAGTSMVTNSVTNGTQQDCTVEDMTIHGNKANGAVVGDGLLFDSMFVGTRAVNVKIRYCSGNGLHTKTTTSSVVFGAAEFRNLECDNNGLDQVLIEGAFQGICFTGYTDVEHFAATHHGIHIKGVHNTAGGGSGVTIDHVYSENSVANAASVWVEAASNVSIGMIEERGGNFQAGAALLRITGTNQWATNSADGAKGIHCGLLYGFGGVGTLLVDDQTRSIAITGTQSPSTWQGYDTEPITIVKPAVHNVGGGGDPAFQNSWVNYANGFDTAGYSKSAEGLVVLRGTVTSGSSNTATIFTLPAGFRPNGTRAFTCTDSGGQVRVEIDANGNVFKSGGTTGFTHLDGCAFFAA